MNALNTLILTDGRGMDAACDGADKIVISFSHASILACRPGDAVDRLMQLSDHRDRARRFAGSVYLLFQGYDEDPRELPSIPEVRRFFAAVTDHWPYWMHFLDADTPAEQITLAIGLLTPCKPVPSNEPGQRFEFEPTALSSTIERLMRAMMPLHIQHEISPEQAQRRVDAIAKVLDRGYR